MLLCDAAKAGSIETVRELLSGTTQDHDTKEMEEALITAAFYGHLEIVKLLAEYGVNLNARSTIGFTALHEAVQNLYLEIARYLLDHGVDVNVPDADGQTPLHWAIDTEIEEALSVYAAARPASSAMTALLVVYHADVNARTIAGETPLDWAIRRRHTAAAELLREHGAIVGKGQP